MTEEQFEAWCTDETRTEFVDGEVIQMGSVSAIHDTLFHLTAGLLGTYLEICPGGRVLGPKFQVRLRPRLRRVPDLMFVTDGKRDLLTDTYLAGAPDAVFEIVSQESVAQDWRVKFYDYEASGVREYWIIDPAHQVVHLYALVEGRYQKVAETEGRLGSAVIPGFWLKPEWLWQGPVPGVLACLREMGVLS